MVDAEPILRAAFFVLTAAVFLHVSARFWIGKTKFRRSLATALILSIVGAALLEFQPPTVLSLIFLATAALVTIQIVYKVGMKESVLIALVYLIITTIVAGVVRSILWLLG